MVTLLYNSVITILIHCFHKNRRCKSSRLTFPYSGAPSDIFLQNNCSKKILVNVVVPLATLYNKV